jgi:hypothetical protein
MKRYHISKLLPLLLAGLVGTITVAVAVQTTQVITTPNGAIIGYNLAPGANSGAIKPAASQAVHVMGVQNTIGFRGVGDVTLLRVPGSFLEWVGLESPSGAAITSGFSGTPGTHIVFLDFSHQVDIQVDTTDTFRIHNGSTGLRTGNVTLIW